MNSLYYKFFPILLIILFVDIVPLAYALHFNELISDKKLTHIKFEYDTDTFNRFTAWNFLLQNNLEKTEIEKITLVNNFFNQMKWIDDSELWGKKDYWATPIESLIKNSGDCEDFSIAKYFTLLAIGIPVNKLKISYVLIKEDNQAHMVLAYYKTIKSVPLILDNIETSIKTLSERTDLEFRFNFNDEGIFNHDNPYEKIDLVDKIPHWAELIKKMYREQI